MRTHSISLFAYSSAFTFVCAFLVFIAPQALADSYIGKKRVTTSEPVRKTRNVNSTPINSVLPISPATAHSRKSSETRKGKELILKAKGLLFSGGFDAGTLNEFVTARFKVALFNFQKANKLTPTGLLDDETIKALGGLER
jgi:hypothetical protein